MTLSIVISPSSAFRPGVSTSIKSAARLRISRNRSLGVLAMAGSRSRRRSIISWSVTVATTFSSMWGWGMSRRGLESIWSRSTSQLKNRFNRRYWLAI